MALPSLYHFVAASRLLEHCDLREIMKKVRREMEQEPTDDALGAALLKSGAINSWQLSQLLEGRTKFNLSRYRIIDSIGQGGYGQVFLARILPLDFSKNLPLVAVKVLPVGKATPEIIARFQREIELQLGLAHPRLVRFLDYGFDGNVHFMVHEYVPGGDLRQRIRDEERLSPNVAAKITLQIAEAVKFLHSNGIVHRDIKPANILIANPGEAKLADMGFAVRIDLKRENENLTESFVSATLERYSSSSDRADSVSESIDKEGIQGKLAGTADYMAPDQIRAPHDPSPSWDIYSLGCTLYQMLTGIVPFPRGDARQKIMAQLQQEPPDARMFNQAIPFDMVSLLWEMMAKNPAERIHSLDEIILRLRPWAQDISEMNANFDSFEFPNRDPEPAGEIVRHIDLSMLDPPASPSTDFIQMEIPGTNTSLRIQVPPVLPLEPASQPVAGAGDASQDDTKLFGIWELSEDQWTIIEGILSLLLYVVLIPMAFVLASAVILWIAVR